MKICHIADIHWRGSQRHEEYTEVFSKFFERMEEINPDLILVAGDIVHSKTQGITPELIDRLRWWFENLAKWKTIVIPGNHDGLIHNKSRLDAISPIISAMNLKNIIWVKNSCNFEVLGINFSHFSCFDEENWGICEPAEDKINIALYHGAVAGSNIETGIEIEGEVSLDIFKKYDYTLLGDIHKRQFLNKKKTIAYPGSTIQQNYGEDVEKGFLIWDIKSKTDFKVEFEEIKNEHQFITIAWSDQKRIIEEAKKYSNKARFRIVSNEVIQPEIVRLISNELKTDKSSEVVWRYDAPESTLNSITVGSEEIETEKVTDDIPELFKKYAIGNGSSDAAATEIKQIVSKLIEEIPSDEKNIGTKWHIEGIKFSNTFGYGEDNSINLESVNGIIGIFGKNAAGKSSIPGTLMYTLFNTTDRGPIKNLHIINSRKDYCRGSVVISNGHEKFEIERQSVKHQNKSGYIHAVTHLNLFKIKNGEKHDLSGEQRKESDKILRNIIGTSEDFLLTSFASQGFQNSFIDEKATARKQILSRFLNLGIFDLIYQKAKEKSQTIKHMLKNATYNHEEEIITRKTQLQILKEKINELTLQKDELTEQVIEATGLLSNIKETTLTSQDITLQENLIKSINSDILKIENEIKKSNEDLEIDKKKLHNAETAIEKFNIQEKEIEIQKIEKTKSAIEEQIKIKNALQVTIKNLNKSIDKIKDVPCGTDLQKKCKYIKDSHADSMQLPGELKKLNEIIQALDSLAELFNESEFIEKKDRLQKAKMTKDKLPSLKNSILAQESNIDSKNNLLAEKQKKFIFESDKLEVFKNSFDKIKEQEKKNKMQIEINLNKSKIRQIEANMLECINNVAVIDNEIKLLLEDYEKQTRYRALWKIYETILFASSKDGLPLQIIATKIPKINFEINKILQGVVNFEISIEADHQTGDLDVWLSYDDNKRPIEMCSGMEKMMSSIAIRAAMIEISKLSKSDIFIIDEGFGALDDLNLESCSRLLIALKSIFKNILIISHVDGIKDIVDHIIEIRRDGFDSLVQFE